MFEAAEKLSAELVARGLTVIYDDRAGKVSPGVKFKDAELLGVPTIVTVGRGLADGNVEVCPLSPRFAGGRADRGALNPRRGPPGRGPPGRAGQ
jgi:hypothetical protein